MLSSFLYISYFDLHGNRNYFGCCSKPPLIVSVDEASKGLRSQGQRVKKPSISMDLSTSTYDIDNSAFQSQRSMSSISTLNQVPDPHSTTAASTNPTEFVNYGLPLWNQTRKQWVESRSSHKHKEVQDQNLSCNASYESLLGTNNPFLNPIPLPQMIDFLVDVWEKDGLYD